MPNTHALPMSLRRIARIVISCASLLLTGQLAFAQTCQPPGLVAWWPGENSAADATGVHNGNLVGGMTFAPGIVGSAFKFNGTNSVRVPDAPALNPTNAITAEAWINPSPGQGDYPPIIKKDGTDREGYALEMAGDRGVCFYVFIHGRGWAGACAGVTPGQWSHVAGVYDGQQVVLYVNGVLVASNAIAGTIEPPGGPLGIGLDPALNRHYSGLIDEPAVFDRALSADEILAIFTARGVGKCAAFDPSAPPVLKLPADLKVSSGPAGRLVFFDAYAWDPTDGRLPATCSPASGSPFPTGITPVSCAATDSSGLSVSGGFIVTVVQTTVDPGGLIGQWKFDELSGATALDSSGNVRHGAIAGATYTSDDGADIPMKVSALRFDGTGAVIVGNVPALTFFSADPFTVTFWVRAPADFAGEYGFLAGTTPPSCAYSDYAVFNGPDGVYLLGAAAHTRRLEPGRLTHVAAVYDGAGSVRMYSDGMVDGPASSWTVGSTPGSQFSIGRAACAGGGGFRGMLDDVRVYNRALSTLEVSSLNGSRSLEADATIAPYSKTATFRAVLFSRDLRVPGRTVTFIRAGTVVGTAVTDFAGVATLANVAVAGLDVGEYPAAIGASVAADAQLPASSSAAMLTIQPDTPVISWSLPTLPIGATPDPSLLNATANVAGSFTCSAPLAGATLTIGSDFCVTFTPADQVRYTTVTKCVRVASMGISSEAALAVGGAYGARVVTGVAVDSVRNLVYAADSADGTIAVINGSTNQTLAGIVLQLGSLSGRAALIAVDAALNRLYVTDADNPVLWTIDTANRTVIGAVQVPYSGAWTALDFNPTTRLLYLAISDQELVAVIDPALAAQALALVPVAGLEAHSSFAIDPVTNQIYIGTAVTNDRVSGQIILPSGIAVLGGEPADASSFNLVTRHIPLSGGAWYPPALAVNSRSQLLYASPRVEAFPGDVPLLWVFDGNPARPSYAQLADSIELPPSTPISMISSYYGYIHYAAVAVDPVSNTIYVKLGAIDDGGLLVSEIVSVDGATRLPTPLATFRNEYVLHDLNFGALSVNPTTGRLYVSDGEEPSTRVSTLVFRVPRETTAALPAATGSSTIDTPQASLTFAGVTAGGTTTIEQIDASQTNLQLPGQYSIGDALAYEISTTASVVAPIQLCFNVSSVNDAGTFNMLAVLHGENGAWVDRTASRDFPARTICASVSSLSPFAIARRTGPAHQLQALYDTAKAASAGSTVPVRVKLVDASGRNVSGRDTALRAVSLVSAAGAALPVEDAGHANRGGLFRFDPGLGGYVFNLSTRGLARGSYRLLVEGPDAPLRYVVEVLLR